MSSLKLHTYKNFIKSLLKTERRGRIQQLQNENKRKISIMTYERMQIIRKQQFIKDSNDEQKKLILQLNLLNQKIKILKNYNPLNDKSLLFLKDSSPFKQLFQTDIMESQNDSFDRIIESWKDATNFLINQREYDELMELYDLSNKYTQQEKIKATANRVGLDVPL